MGWMKRLKQLVANLRAIQPSEKPRLFFLKQLRVAPPFSFSLAIFFGQLFTMSFIICFFVYSNNM